MVARYGAVLAALAITTGRAGSAARQQSVAYRVVLHASNPVAELTREEVSQMFLGRTRTWRDGRPILVVNQAPDAPVRHSFSRGVHGRSVSSVVSHWRQQVYLRRGSPPPEVSSDQHVLTFIRANPNAVGYVRAETDLGRDIKVLVVGPARP